MLTILQKEFNAFLNSPVAYVVIGVFLVATGLFVWVFPDSSVLDYGYADLQSLFNLAPWIFLLLIPAITMRTFAEEKKAGTIELLLTRPLTDGQLVGGKYLACLLLALLDVAPLPRSGWHFACYGRTCCVKATGRMRNATPAAAQWPYLAELVEAHPGCLTPYYSRHELWPSCRFLC